MPETFADFDPIVSVETINERGQTKELLIPNEKTFHLRVNGRELMTFRTVCQRIETLAVGWLFNSQVIQSISAVQSISMSGDTVSVTVAEQHMPAHEQRLEDSPDISVTPSLIAEIVDRTHEHASLYRQVRSVHACALFSLTGELLYCVEDLGRHNTVDMISGAILQQNWNPAACMLYTTARLTVEMVEKIIQMGIPVMISRSGTSNTAVRLARQMSRTLIGRARGGQFLAFTGSERIAFAEVV